MKFTIKKQIGSQVYPFTFEGETLHECVMESQKLSFYNVPKCECGSTNLYLGARIAKSGDKKFKYTFVKCNNHECRAELTFGEKADGSGTVYLRKNDDKSLAWKSMDKDYSKLNGKIENKPDDVDKNDIPF